MDNDFKTYLEGKGLKLVGAVEIAAPVVFALFGKSCITWLSGHTIL